MDELIERALGRDKRAVSQLVSLFEDQRADAVAKRAYVLSRLHGRKSAVVIGLTGTPGSGKSSLLARLTLALLATSELSVAVLAVDPSSHISGGALLGDRTRMQLPHDEKRVFFRSQASATELGGLGPWSYQVCRLLALLFDGLLVETVGIGQSEADIRHLADRVYLVMAPLGGDEIQFLKAGIMEVPQAFVLNKSDDPSADRSYHTLRGTLGLARPLDGHDVPIYRTSAKTGLGIDALTRGLLTDFTRAAAGLATREPYFFERWVRDEWGRFGVRALDAQGGAESYLRRCMNFERAQADFSARLHQRATSK
ncbi:MAG TPA: hypothetical protein VFX59_29980 [Polyangiales bacterium]|nr:hypothetical protein [Polyangiales bacterium]